MVGQEAEFQRRHRALDRQVDKGDDQPAEVEPVQRLAQGLGARGGVEGEDVPLPSGPGQPVGLVRQQLRAGGHDQDVVIQRVAVRQVHSGRSRRRRGRRGLAVGDAVMRLPPARAPCGYPLHVDQAERDEQQSRRWYTWASSRSTDDVGGLRPVGPPQPVREQRPPVPPPRMTIRFMPSTSAGTPPWSGSLVPGTGDDLPRSLPPPGEQDLGGADAGDDRPRENYRRRISSSTAIHATRSNPARCRRPARSRAPAAIQHGGGKLRDGHTDQQRDAGQHPPGERRAGQPAVRHAEPVPDEPGSAVHR